MDKKLKEWIKEGVKLAIVICLFVISFHVVLPACGCYFFEVTGHSMEPTLWTGDFVLVIKTQDYKVGDIIVFKNPREDILVIHRIIKMDDKETIWTKGDNCLTPDPPIQPSAIIGKVVIIFPQLKTILYILAFIILILLIILEIPLEIPPIKKKTSKLNAKSLRIKPG